MNRNAEKISNIAFYKFLNLEDPESLKVELHALCHKLKLRGTILVAHEGLNGMLAGPHDAIENFLASFLKRPEFGDTLIKKSYSATIPFSRLLIKVKKEILTLRRDVPFKKIAPYIKAEVLRQLLRAKAAVTLIDVRNHFEVEYGTFENAVNPNTKSFGEFPRFIKNLNVAKDEMIVTFCTGGIRCEKAAALLLEAGYQNVHQLEGGILEYFSQTQGEFFKGHCFVFDNREALNTKLEPASLPESKLPQKINKLKGSST